MLKHVAFEDGTSKS